MPGRNIQINVFYEHGYDVFKNYIKYHPSQVVNGVIHHY